MAISSCFTTIPPLSHEGLTIVLPKNKRLSEISDSLSFLFLFKEIISNHYSSFFAALFFLAFCQKIIISNISAKYTYKVT